MHFISKNDIISKGLCQIATKANIVKVLVEVIILLAFW